MTRTFDYEFNNNKLIKENLFTTDLNNNNFYLNTYITDDKCTITKISEKLNCI